MSKATCQSCICCSAVIIEPDLCKELRATGACLVQNQQRVIVLVVKPEQAAQVTILMKGGGDREATR